MTTTTTTQSTTTERSILFSSITCKYANFRYKHWNDLVRCISQRDAGTEAHRLTGVVD